MGTISFQKVFTDLSTLLMTFPDVTAEMTLEELLVWMKNILESDEIEFVLEGQEDGE